MMDTKEGDQMHRVFLANDNATFCETLRESLERDMSGFSLVGEAADSATALSMARDLCPDILIADLRIPFEEILLFCRQVRQSFPWIQIVLMSSYDDLNHAREAEETGIFEYLIRPVSIYELQEALRRAAGRAADAWQTLVERIRATCEEVPEERRTLDARLDGWLQGEDPSGCPVRGRWRYCRLLAMTMARGELLWIAQGMLRLIEREYEVCGRLHALELSGGPVLAVVSDDLEELENVSYGVAYTLCHAAKRFLGERPSIRVSACLETPEQLWHAYRAIRQPPQQQTEARPILGCGDALRKNPGVRPKVNPLGEWLLCACQEDVSEILARIARILPLSEKGAAMVVEQLADEVGGTMDNSQPPQTRSDQLCQAIAWRDAHAPGFRHQPLSRVRSFVARNYQRPGVPMYEAARLAEMSVNRFRVVFAQEMGMTFTDYLAHLRVTAAKYLLVHTRRRISGIAQSVGVGDVGCFENLFYRYVGMSPREYRRQNA